MGTAKRKITDLNKKYEKERNKKNEIVRNVYAALQWWERTMDNAAELINSFYHEEIRIINGNLGFLEWLSVSPVRFIRWIGHLLYRKPFRIDELYKRHGFLRDKLRVERILDGREKLAPIQIARRLQLSTERLEEILTVVAEERGGKVEESKEQQGEKQNV